MQLVEQDRLSGPPDGRPRAFSASFGQALLYGKVSSISLPFDWVKSQTGDAVTRVRSIYRLVAEGHTLRTAAQIAECAAPAVTVNWEAMAERFRVQKLEHGSTIKPSTWEPVRSDTRKVPGAVSAICSAALRRRDDLAAGGGMSSG